MGSSRTNTGLSTINNAAQRRLDRRRGLRTINYEQAQQLEIWQVARAATAANFYFEPLRIENARFGGFDEFTDGGFGQANNPTRTGVKEIEDLHGLSSIGIVVSVGTARKLKEDAKKANFFSTIPNSAREFADTATDPEIVHNQMQQDHNRDNAYPYYRLNHPGGLQTELDEWEPKRKYFNKKDGGTRTIKDIETAFAKWAANPDNIEQLQGCATALVGCRRERKVTEKWERYATGSFFKCRATGCKSGDFLHCHEFENHHRERHDLKDQALKDEVNDCRRHWRYQAASNP